MGALGTLCKPAALGVQLFMPMPAPNPIIDAIRDDPLVRNFMIFSTLTGTLISLLLLMSSLGSLALRPWARGGMFGYAALALLMTAVTLVVNGLLVAPKMQAVIRQSGMPEPPGSKIMSGPAGVAIGILIGLWYPVLILVFYNRRHVKAAFERGLGGKGIWSTSWTRLTSKVVSGIIKKPP